MMPDDFNSVWDALTAPIKALEDRVTDMQRQARRSEVAGAVEVVTALPAAGEKGRLLYLLTDNLIYYDNGTTWLPMGGGTVASSYQIPIAFSNNSTTSWRDVIDSSFSHTFTRTTALILGTWLQQSSASTKVLGRFVVGSIEGTKNSVVTSTLFPVTLSDVFNVSGLSGSQTIKLQHRAENAGVTSTIRAALGWNVTIVEY